MFVTCQYVSIDSQPKSQCIDTQKPHQFRKHSSEAKNEWTEVSQIDDCGRIDLCHFLAAFSSRRDLKGIWIRLNNCTRGQIPIDQVREVANRKLLVGFQPAYYHMSATGILRFPGKKNKKKTAKLHRFLLEGSNKKSNIHQLSSMKMKFRQNRKLMNKHLQ